MYVFLRFFCGVQIVPVIDAKGLRWLLAPYFSPLAWWEPQ